MGNLHFLSLFLLPCIFPVGCGSVRQYGQLFNYTWVNNMNNQEMYYDFLAAKPPIVYTTHANMWPGTWHMVQMANVVNFQQFFERYIIEWQEKGDKLLKVNVRDMETYDIMQRIIGRTKALWLIIHFDFFFGPNNEHPPRDLWPSERLFRNFPPFATISLGIYSPPSDKLGYTQVCLDAFETDNFHHGFSLLYGKTDKIFVLHIEHITHTEDSLMEALWASLKKKGFSRFELYLQPGDINRVDIGALKKFLEQPDRMKHNDIYFNVPQAFLAMYFEKLPESDKPVLIPNPNPNRRNTDKPVNLTNIPRNPQIEDPQMQSEINRKSSGSELQIRKLLLLTPLYMFF